MSSSFDRLDAEEHRQRLRDQEALADAIESLKAEGLVERHHVGFGVRHHTHAAKAVALLERQAEDMTQERLADTEALRPSVDAEACKPQDRNRVAWQAFPQARARHGSALDRARGDRREAHDARLDRRHVRDGQVELELVLPGVVLEEAIEVGLAAGEVAAVVVPRERTELNGLGHASAREAPLSARQVSRAA
jgi:hypothetical protein